MTLLTERPEASSSTTETTLKAATADHCRRHRSARRQLRDSPRRQRPRRRRGQLCHRRWRPKPVPVTRGSYVTVDGTPVVAASVIEGSYVTLPTAA